MSYVLPAITGGIGLARSIFGGKKYKYKPQDPFMFRPNEQDPGLALRRRRALSDLSASRGSTLNEVNRSGLLGSGAGFAVQQEAETQGQQGLHDVDLEEFMRQRDEQLQQYNSEEAFRRQRALMGDEANYRDQSSGLESLGDIGSSIGMGYGMGGSDTGDYGGYLTKRFGGMFGRRNRGLRSSLLAASDYTTTHAFR
jgi:hypothetical protein